MINFIEKVREILLNPRRAWERVKGEDGKAIKNLILYAALLSVVPAVSIFIGYGFLGLHWGMAYFRLPPLNAFFCSLVAYLLNLAGLALAAFMLNFTMRYFQVEGSWEAAAKLAVYSATAYLLSGIFNLVPALRFLSILGLYGIYTIYIGIPVMLKVPQEKTLSFILTVAIILIVLAFIINTLISQFIFGFLLAEYLTI